MTIIKKLAVLGIAGLALGATACGGSSTETAATSTTAAPASSTTTEKEESTTTTEDEDDEPTTTKVTRPAKVEKIDRAELPAATPTLPAEYEVTADEEDCVYTVVYEYALDPANEQDELSIAMVTGGAMAVCIDQGKLAVAITASIAEAAPNLDADQLACIENEILVTDTESLAIFIGALVYEGPDAEELREPFRVAFEETCGLSS